MDDTHSPTIKGIRFEMSSHALSRIVDRSALSTDELIANLKKDPNYIQKDGRKVWYYDNEALVLNREEPEFISLIKRNSPRKDWREL